LIDHMTAERNITGEPFRKPEFEPRAKNRRRARPKNLRGMQ
jgi:hypothetical protein